jgi:hypothetical protein
MDFDFSSLFGDGGIGFNLPTFLVGGGLASTGLGAYSAMAQQQYQKQLFDAQQAQATIQNQLAQQQEAQQQEALKQQSAYQAALLQQQQGQAAEQLGLARDLQTRRFTLADQQQAQVAQQLGLAQQLQTQRQGLADRLSDPAQVVRGTQALYQPFSQDVTDNLLRMVQRDQAMKGIMDGGAASYATAQGLAPYALDQQRMAQNLYLQSLGQAATTMGDPSSQYAAASSGRGQTGALIGDPYAQYGAAANLYGQQGALSGQMAGLPGLLSAPYTEYQGASSAYGQAGKNVGNLYGNVGGFGQSIQQLALLQSLQNRQPLNPGDTSIYRQNLPGLESQYPQGQPRDVFNQFGQKPASLNINPYYNPANPYGAQFQVENLDPLMIQRSYAYPTGTE